MSSANNANDIKCRGIRYLPWSSLEGTILLVKCFYSKQASATIISPTDIIINYIHDYNAWTQHDNMKTGRRCITFANTTTNQCLKYYLTQQNGLWFYHFNDYNDHFHSNCHEDNRPTINRLNAAGTYDLVHTRLGHPGE